MITAGKVSCLCVTQPGREALRARAVADFHTQTYPDKELVIVTDPKDGTHLGELRNRALDRATGEFIATWDDDDYNAPTRLESQLDAMLRHDLPLGFLGQVTLRCICGFAAPSQVRPLWENTFVGRADFVRSSGVRYPRRERGEDTIMLQALMALSPRVVAVQDPSLYTYRFHGGNTWQADHWDGLMLFAGAGHAPSLCL